MDILSPISVGELLDKISILQIKQEKIDDAEKVLHVEQGFERLIHRAHMADFGDKRTFSSATSGRPASDSVKTCSAWRLSLSSVL